MQGRNEESQTLHLHQLIAVVEVAHVPLQDLKQCGDVTVTLDDLRRDGVKQRQRDAKQGCKTNGRAEGGGMCHSTRPLAQSKASKSDFHSKQRATNHKLQRVDEREEEHGDDCYSDSHAPSTPRRKKASQTRRAVCVGSVVEKMAMNHSRDTTEMPSCAGVGAYTTASVGVR